MGKSRIELLPHNQDLYNRIRKHINEGKHSIFYSEATGLGKSFIFMKLVEDLFQGKKVLYIVPKDSIWYNINLYDEFNIIKDNIIKTTFADFNKIKDHHYDYDVIFIDEAHHLLSDIQGFNLINLINSYVKRGKYVFGFTATPYIKRKNMSVDSLFEISLIGLDLFESIEEGLFKKFDYALADFDTIVDEKYAKNFSVKGGKTLIRNLMDQRSDINRWLVYFSTISKLEENIEQFKKYFPEYKLFIMHMKSDNDNEQIQKDFNNYTGKCMILTVDMLLEGTHLKDVSGIIMFRNVSQWHTFLQIIGRCFKINMKSCPLIIDMTQSLNNFINKKKTIHKMLNRIVSKSGKTLKEFINITSSSCQMIDLCNCILNSLYYREYRGIIWINDADLCRKLGKHKSYVCFQKSHYGLSEEQIIDKVLDEENKILMYRGITWRSNVELSLKLGKTRSYVYNYIKSGLTHEQIIDNVLDESKKYSYRGISWNSERELSLKLGKYETFVTHLRISGLSYEEIIDEVLNTTPKYCYRGITWNTNRELSSKLGKNLNYVNSCIKNKQKTVEQIIDLCLDGRYPERSYRGISWTTIRSLSIKIGLNESTISTKISEGMTCENIIDIYLDGKPAKYSYKGISWNSNKELSLKLGKNENFVGYYIKNKGLTYEQIIDKVLAEKQEENE